MYHFVKPFSTAYAKTCLCIKCLPLVFLLLVLLPIEAMATTTDAATITTELDQLQSMVTRLKAADTPACQSLIRQGQALVVHEQQLLKGHLPLQLEVKETLATLQKLQRQDKALMERIHRYKSYAGNRYEARRINTQMKKLKKALKDTIDFANNDLNVRVNVQNNQMVAQRVAFIEDAEQTLRMLAQNSVVTVNSEQIADVASIEDKTVALGARAPL
ncbi:MAG: hypothetical protein HRT35_33110 [Algicola sp.]|nr:hypothetical protein [Algicola sp.]